MKRVFIGLFLIFSLSAQCQTFTDIEQEVKEIIEDTLDRSVQRVGGKALDIKEVGVQVPISDSTLFSDSTLLKHVGNKAKGIAIDTLRSKLPPLLEPHSGMLEQLSKQKLDSAILNKTKSIAEKAIKDTLGNYVDVPDIKLDSTTIGQIKAGAETRSKAVLKEKGIEIPDVTIDSTLNGQIKSEAKARAKSALENETGADLPEITIDSTTAKQVKEEVVRRAENALQSKGEFKAMESLKESPEIDKLKGYNDKLVQKQEAMARKKIKQKLASHARQYISKHAGKIKEVQSKIGTLKKKYAYMPNSNDLDNAIKRTSLEGESLWKRAVIGGNFNIGKTNPLSIDISPVIGYKVNKLFEIGVTGAYRTQFKADRNGINARHDNVYGYSVFANHMVFKNFFGYVEGERLNTASLYTESLKREWKQTLLIGLGRKFNVAKWLEMQAMVLVNVLHDNQDGLYNSPIVFKTAVRLRK